MHMIGSDLRIYARSRNGVGLTASRTACLESSHILSVFWLSYLLTASLQLKILRELSKELEIVRAVHMPGKKASTEFSCVVCTQRKVRCDKNKPCKNCVKAGIKCEVAPPPPPRRRKRKLDEQELLRKLAKYEEFMEKKGVDFRSIDNDFGSPDDDPDAENPSKHDETGSHDVAYRYLEH